jgi:hypothetical protein
MFYRRNWIAVIVVILGLTMFIPVAQAQRQDVENINCGATTYNVVQFSPEVAIMSYDAKAITQQSTIKLFENTTWHCVGVVKMVGGKSSWNSLCKSMSPDGEFIVWDGYGDSESGSTWKAVYGTGKWKGIKSEGKSKVLTTVKPIVQGTNQLCEKYIGWIELAK